MAEPRAVTDSRESGSALIGAAVGAYAVFDVLFYLIVVGTLAALLNPFVVFVCTVVVAIVVNVAAGTYVDGNWDRWIATKPGQKVEAKLTKMRAGRIMRHPVRWITEGSSFLFAAAAFLINPVIVTGIARLVSGKPIGARRIRVASVAYAIFVALVFTALGRAVGFTIEAL